MNKFAVVLFTRNEEKNIKEAIESAKVLSRNIVVIDMESTDKTVEIAKREGARVFSFPYKKYVEPARNFGIKRAEADWIFILDADERITQELADEIKRRCENEKYGFYKVPRKNIFGGKKWLKHGGWWPDYQIRLIKKSAFVNWPERIHSTPEIKGEGGFLKNPLLHYFHGDFEKMVEKTIIFESIEAELLFEARRGVGILTFFRKYLGELYRRLIKHKGFLDGKLGIIESFYQAFSKTITYIFLYEKYVKAGKKS